MSLSSDTFLKCLFIEEFAKQDRWRAKCASEDGRHIYPLAEMHQILSDRESTAEQPEPKHIILGVFDENQEKWLLVKVDLEITYLYVVSSFIENANIEKTVTGRSDRAMQAVNRIFEQLMQPESLNH